MTPRITLAVVAYRQAPLIEAAVRSAFAQACEPIEVLLSDDCSPDDTFARMQALAADYRGPHRVTLRQNARNLGIGAHVDAVIRAAAGELIVAMAGDDISMPQRVARVAAAWDASGQKADLIASDVIDMSFEGEDLGVLHVDDLARWRSLEDWLRRRPYVVGAAHAFTRRLVERFGPIPPHVMHEDQVNVLRAVLAGGALTVAEPLVRYRRGGVSDGAQGVSAERHLAWLRRQTEKHVSLHAQWLADARTAGCEAAVAAAIADEAARERFVLALLDAPGAAGRLSEALRPWPLPLGWRLRKAAQLATPGFTARLRAWQAARKQRRREGRR